MPTSLSANLRGISALLLAVALTAIGVRTYLQSDPSRLPWVRPGTPKIVYIKPKTGVQEIAQTLWEAGVIRSRWAFLGMAYLQGSPTRLKAGEYEFTHGMSLREILGKLEAGRVVTHQISIPEGFTARDIAQLLAGEKLVDTDRFMALVADARFVEGLGVAGTTLEGYLFPDTYRLTRGMDEGEIILIMVARFWQAAPRNLDVQARRVGLDVHSVVTLASLIEKEAKLDSERPLVAAVFYNRLRRNMPLQSDPTAVYDVPRPRRRITPLDLKRRTPYNTYLKAGLPPGPIANPGVASLQAALNPAHVTYLYFVAKNDGSHYFSWTLKQHAEAVRKYQGRSDGSASTGS